MIGGLARNDTVQIYKTNVFNGSNDCSKDIQVTIDGTICMVCKITATANASSISVNNNDIPSNPTDDYFTVSVKANAVSKVLTYFAQS